MITGLQHIAILASEKAWKVAFYETLGFRVKESHVRQERLDEIVFMTGGGVLLEVFVSKAPPMRVSWPEAYGLRHAAFTVADVPLAREQLICAGYQPEEPRRDSFTGAAMFFVADPDGLLIEIHE